MRGIYLEGAGQTFHILRHFFNKPDPIVSKVLAIKQLKPD